MGCYVSWCWLADFFFFSSRRRHTRYWRDWSSDVCSSDLLDPGGIQGSKRALRESLGRQRDDRPDLLEQPGEVPLLGPHFRGAEPLHEVPHEALDEVQHVFPDARSLEDRAALRVDDFPLHVHH